MIPVADACLMPTGPRRQRKASQELAAEGTPRSTGPPFGERANEALTNLSMYALALDVKYHRLDDRLLELAKAEAEATDLVAVLRERDEAAAECEAFRGALVALRDHVVARADCHQRRRP